MGSRSFEWQGTEGIVWVQDEVAGGWSTVHSEEACDLCRYEHYQSGHVLTGDMGRACSTRGRSALFML